MSRASSPRPPAPRRRRGPRAGRRQPSASRYPTPRTVSIQRPGVAELRPQVVDVRVDGVGRHRDGERPRLVEELVAGERLARVAEERLEQRELARAQVDRACRRRSPGGLPRRARSRRRPGPAPRGAGPARRGGRARAAARRPPGTRTASRRSRRRRRRGPATRSLTVSRAVSIRMLTSRPSLRMRRATSRPDMSGSPMSRMTASSPSSAEASSMPVRPSGACSTTWRSSSRRRVRLRARRSSSSTRRRCIGRSRSCGVPGGAAWVMVPSGRRPGRRSSPAVRRRRRSPWR